MFIPDVINTLLMGLIFMVVIVTIVRPFVLNLVGEAPSNSDMQKAAIAVVERELVRKAELFEAQRADKIKYQMLLLEKPEKPKSKPVLESEELPVAEVAPDIEALQAISKTHDLLLIEDNAHGLGGAYKGKPLGSFGDFATQSFHATKNIQCGEGGALVVNNPKFIERAEIVREKGTNRSKFLRGEAQKYQWVDQGSSYLLAESLSAILLGQLENFGNIQSSRRITAISYLENIDKRRIFLKKTEQIGPAHLFFLEFQEVEFRNRFILEMNYSKIQCTSHYEPLHSSSFGRAINEKTRYLNNSTKFSETIARLPLWIGIDELVPNINEETNRILNKIL